VRTGDVTVYLAIHDKKLLKRRLHAGPAAERTRTQKIIMAFAMTGFVALLVVPVLDHRFGWSPAVPAHASISAEVLVALSFLITFFVIRENSYATVV